MGVLGGEALPGVSRTAVWLAGLRAIERGRADRLVDDHLAEVFVSAAAAGGGVPDTTGLPPGAREFLAIRTRFFDDQALEACAAGVSQVVLLAAGLDSRAFRLDWPTGVRLFELDLPELFAFKEPVLASAAVVPHCGRVVVGVDLREDWTGALAAAGHQSGGATVWLAEGLLPYLSQQEGERLLAAVTGLSAPGSRIAVDHLEATADDRPAMRSTADVVRRMGANLTSTVDSPVQWLAAHGWRTTVSRVPALGERYGCPLPGYVDLAASNATALVAAVR